MREVDLHATVAASAYLKTLSAEYRDSGCHAPLCSLQVVYLCM